MAENPRVVRSPAELPVFTIQRPDGTVTTEPSDEIVEVVHRPAEGTVTTEYRDGTFKTEYSDGTIKTEHPDGSVTTQHPNGMVVTTDPDGKVEQAYPEVQANAAGLPIDIGVLKDEQKSSSGKDSETSGNDAASVTASPLDRIGTADTAAALGELDPDVIRERAEQVGRPVYDRDTAGEWVDGGDTTVEDGPGTTDSGGSVTTHNPDGSVTTQNPDGSVTTEYPDGSVLTEYPDGRTRTEHPDGTVQTTFEDGEDGGTAVRTEHPDGTVTTERSDGSVATKYPDGTIKTEHPDGRVTTYSPDGTLTTEYPDGTVTTEQVDQTVYPTDGTTEDDDDGTLTFTDSETENDDGTVTVSDPEGTTGADEEHEGESPDLTDGSHDTPAAEEGADPVIPDPPRRLLDSEAEVVGPERPHFVVPEDEPFFDELTGVNYQETRPELETVGAAGSVEPDFELDNEDPLE